MQGATSERWQLAGVATFILVNLIAPFLVGEYFPFTTSPMYSDSPQIYCTYKIFDEDNLEINVDYLGLRQIYNGNPPGLGVGLKPPETANHFGKQATEKEVKEMVQRNLTKFNYKFVIVEQYLVHDLDGNKIGPTAIPKRWQVENPKRPKNPELLDIKNPAPKDNSKKGSSK